MLEPARQLVAVALVHPLVGWRLKGLWPQQHGLYGQVGERVED